MSSSIPANVRAHVRAVAANRCGYCLSQQRYLVASLEIDHIIPKVLGGSDDEENLWLACRSCNVYKGKQTHGRDPATGRRIRLFNPRRQSWRRHFEWSSDGAWIIGRTACGRATVIALRLNAEYALAARREWVNVGWHPPVT